MTQTTTEKLHISTISILFLNTGELLNGAIVRVGSNSDRNNPICGTIKLGQINANQMIELTCNLEDQYLSIELPGTHYLHLCEVQAFEGKCEGRMTDKKTPDSEFNQEYSTLRVVDWVALIRFLFGVKHY